MVSLNLNIRFWMYTSTNDNIQFIASLFQEPAESFTDSHRVEVAIELSVSAKLKASHE